MLNVLSIRKDQTQFETSASSSQTAPQDQTCANGIHLQQFDGQIGTIDTIKVDYAAQHTRKQGSLGRCDKDKVQREQERGARRVLSFESIRQRTVERNKRVSNITKSEID